MKYNDFFLILLMSLFATLLLLVLIFSRHAKARTVTLDPANCPQSYIYDGKGNPVANVNSYGMCCK